MWYRFPVALLMLTLSLMVLMGADEGKKVLVNVDKNGLALQGYDPVAYHTVKKPTKGDPQFHASHQGATYHFASMENRDLFVANPAKYAPLFGGYCAWAVSKGYTAKVDINAFDVVDGRLYLNYDLSIRKTFNKNQAENLQKAHQNWPTLVDKQGK